MFPMMKLVAPKQPNQILAMANAEANRLQAADPRCGYAQLFHLPLSQDSSRLDSLGFQRVGTNSESRETTGNSLFT